MKYYILIILALGITACSHKRGSKHNSSASFGNTKQADIQKKNSENGFWSNSLATHWYDALVSGNGEMGVLIFGNPLNERIICNHEFLYEPIGSEAVNPPKIAKYLDKTRQLMLNGKYEEAAKFSYESALNEGYPGLLWTDPYHPAFAITIDQPENGTIKNYRREVNFETGEISVYWSDNNGDWVRKAFVSRTDGVIVQQIKNLSGRKVNCTVGIEHQKGDVEGRTTYITGGDTCLYIKNPEITVSPEWMVFRLGYSKVERGYEGIVKVIAGGGATKLNNGKLDITNASEVLLLTRINYLENYEKTLIETTKQALGQLSQDYDRLVEPHASIHGEMFSRAKVEFGVGAHSDLPIEELFKKQEETPETILPELINKVYQMGKYTLICTSGNNPPNLVGLWTGDWRPTWCGDFTLDANVNLQVSGVNTLGLNECLDSYLTMIERIAPDWETNAKNLYGCRGYLSGARTSGRRNLNTHFHTGFPGQFWTAGAQWLIYPAFEHYLCTGDKKFLKNRALPLMEKVVLFYEDFLNVTDTEGRFVFVPSYSPENNPSNQNTTAAMNATMDIAAAKQAFENILFAYRELGMAESLKVERWKGILQKFPPYLINNDGALKEWAHGDFSDHYDHRHASHMYPVWPAHQINPDEFPQLTEAARTALEKRGDGDLSTHGIVIKSLAAARLKMPGYLDTKLRQFLSGRFMNKSMVTNHFPDGHVYNCDGICGFPGVVNEMLVYSKPGEIELLPALPSQLSRGRASGLQCRSKLVIEELNWDLDKKEIVCKINPHEDQVVNLKYRKGIKSIIVKNGKAEQTGNGWVKVVLQKGKTITLKLTI